jgi:hypothetical protein
MLPFVKKHFDSSTKFKSFESSAKVAVIVALLRAITFLIGIFVFLFIGIVYLKDFNWNLPRPVKTKYSVENKQYIEEKCAKLGILDISISLPEKWKIYAISGKGKRSILYFLFKEGDSTKSFAIISNGNSFDEMLPVYEELGFSNSYEIEKNFLNKSRLSLFQTVSPLPLWLMPDWDRIEDVTSDNWVGFVKHYRRDCEERVSWTVECSAYSKNLQKSATISISFGEGYMTTEEIKNILATLKFLDQTKSVNEFFLTGKEALKKKDYNNAILNLVNALFFGNENPECYYNIALAFYEKYKNENKDTYLSETKEFLTYTLEIDPEHKEAKKLLSLIEKND